MEDKTSEHKATISHSKNPNTGNIKAGGNVRIGDEIHNHSDKKKVAKELTPIQRTNPDNIIGRESDLVDLHRSLFNNKKVVVVNGLGGIGKTTLAEAYLFKHYEDYQHIVWITQNDKELENDFALHIDLIKNLHISIAGMEPQHIFNEILRALRNLKKSPNLLVVDNADSSVEKYLAALPGQPNWHLLFTSREVIAGMQLKKLGFLNHQEAIQLFQKHCKLFSDEIQIGELVKSLGYHTLTIEILAKTAQRRRVDLQKLKLALESDLKTAVKTKHSKFEKTAKITSYLCSIFDLSELNKDEQWLMKQFAYLPPDFHAFDFLKSFLTKENDPEDFANTLSELNEKGWLIYQTDTDSYKMHRIIAEVTTQKLEIEADDITALIEQVTSLLNLDQTKDNPAEKFQWIPFGEAILKQFPSSDLALIAVLQNNLALRLQDLGDYAGAKNLLEKATISDEKNFGTEHPTTAISYSNLALVLKELGDYAGAKNLLEKATLSDEKNFGTEHPTTAIRYSNLATVLQDLGDYAGAKTLLEKAILSDEKNFGTEHPTTAIRYSNLAAVLKDLGDYTGAKDLLEKATLSDEKNFGTEHPTTARTYSNLATVLRALGDYAGAKDLLEKAILSDEKNFGTEHQKTAIRYSNLALVLKDLGDYERALSLLGKTLEIFEKTLPAGHPYITQTKQTLEAIEKEWKENGGQ